MHIRCIKEIDYISHTYTACMWSGCTLCIYVDAVLCNRSSEKSHIASNAYSNTIRGKLAIKAINLFQTATAEAYFDTSV